MYNNEAQNEPDTKFVSNFIPVLELEQAWAKSENLIYLQTREKLKPFYLIKKECILSFLKYKVT